MIPEGLKIGDTFTETSVDGKVFKSKVVGFDGQGRYIAEFVGMVKPEEAEVFTEEDVITEEDVTPIEQMLTEAVEEPKKAPARKPAARKRSTKKK